MAAVLCLFFAVTGVRSNTRPRFLTLDQRKALGFEIHPVARVLFLNYNLHSITIEAPVRLGYICQAYTQQRCRAVIWKIYLRMWKGPPAASGIGDGQRSKLKWLLERPVRHVMPVKTTAFPLALPAGSERWRLAALSTAFGVFFYSSIGWRFTTRARSPAAIESILRSRRRFLLAMDDTIYLSITPLLILLPFRFRTAVDALASFATLCSQVAIAGLYLSVFLLNWFPELSVGASSDPVWRRNCSHSDLQSIAVTSRHIRTFSRRLPH